MKSYSQSPQKNIDNFLFWVVILNIAPRAFPVSYPGHTNKRIVSTKVNQKRRHQKLSTCSGATESNTFIKVSFVPTTLAEMIFYEIETKILPEPPVDPQAQILADEC